ncbi:MAG: FAD-dependent oxidoreductase [Nitrospira sp. CR1.2]|nr:FAD-dependent oxidoreductase [Nitrospira sp. CR1.2]
MSRQVLILGGGLAGLTAALHLATSGHAVTVLEQADHVGGRLRHAPPPILLEAHHATWSLLNSLGHESAARQLRHTPLEFLQATGARVQFLHLPLPSPLNTLLGTTLFQGLSMRDRWHLLSFLERTWEQDPPLPNDLDSRAADEWLTSIGQSQHARHGVWNSLARLLVGAALPMVSAGLFMRTLRRCFLTGARATKLIVPPQGVDTFLLAPLKARLDALGVQFRVNAAIAQLHFAQHRVTNLELTDRSRLTADWYIAALPHNRLTPLLPERVVTHYAYFQQLSHLSESSMLVVRLHIDRPADHTQLVLVEGKTFHWMIRHADEARHNQASVIWASAVGEPSLLPQPQEDLIRLALDDATAAFPAEGPSPRILNAEILRLPSAMLAARPGAQQFRPLSTSPFTNLLVAGAWTDTGWPANYESAILSGQRCATALAAAPPGSHL